MLKIADNPWLINIDGRCDDIGQAVANNPEFRSAFDECHHLYDMLRFGTSPELIEHLESVHATLMGIVEREFYLAGLRDGMNSNQLFLTIGGAKHVAS